MVVYKHSESGQSLVEVLIAITIVTLVLVTTIAGMTLVAKNSRYSTVEVIATKYNQESLEWLRKQRDTYGWRTFHELVLATTDDDGMNDDQTVYCMPSSFLSTAVLSSGCSAFTGCVTVASSCPLIANLVQKESGRRVLQVEVVDGETIRATARVLWDDGGREHVSDAVLELKKWQ